MSINEEDFVEQMINCSPSDSTASAVTVIGVSTYSEILSKNCPARLTFYPVLSFLQPNLSANSLLPIQSYIILYYFDTIPKSLDEAARIDGANRFQVFTIMLIPLSKPIIIYTALVAFMAPWCDYVFASYVALGHSDSYNVAVAMQRWVWTNDYQGYFTRFCAGGILVAVPITILFMCLQKYYVEGVTGGAVKG